MLGLFILKKFQDLLKILEFLLYKYMRTMKFSSNIQVMTRENIVLMLSEVLTEGMGFVIGKADKRYTLWSYSYEIEGDKRFLKLHYIHNLSDNKDKVMVKWPGVVIWESLRGTTYKVEVDKKQKTTTTTSTPSKPKTWEDYDVIPFGRYKGTSINDINDCDYWCWLANKTREEQGMTINGEYVDFKPLFEKMAEQTGGEKLFDYYWLNKNRNEGWCNNMRNISKAVENNEPFSFVAEKNDNSFYFGVPITFKPEDTYEFYTYYGGGRFLVITDKKGNRKNKRTKGKTIEVTDYSYIKEEGQDRGRILVNSFNIK